MIPNNGIHRINSCKINQSFGGGPTSMIFSSIFFCLIFNRLCFLFVNTWDYFTPVIKLTLFPILALNSLSWYTLHYPIFKIPRISMSLCTMPLFDVMLACLDIHLIFWSSLIKMHIVSYISILTLIFYDNTWETI